MSKPKDTEKLVAIIFLCLGSAFLMIGLLCFIGIVKPSAHSSVQNPMIMGTVFSLLGFALYALQTVLRVISSAKDKSRSELIASGTRLTGTVEKVYLQKYIQYGAKSPYRICYTYRYQGEMFHHKSCLLWDQPGLKEGDSIMDYANDSGRSTVQL